MGRTIGIQRRPSRRPRCRASLRRAPCLPTTAGDPHIATGWRKLMPMTDVRLTTCATASRGAGCSTSRLHSPNSRKCCAARRVPWQSLALGAGHRAVFPVSGAGTHRLCVLAHAVVGSLFIDCAARYHNAGTRTRRAVNHSLFRCMPAHRSLTAGILPDPLLRESCFDSRAHNPPGTAPGRGQRPFHGAYRTAACGRAESDGCDYFGATTYRR